MFPTPLDRYYTDFEDWIAIATSGLGGAAKAQLAEDMSDHYAEAVNMFVARGQSKEAAEADALAQLGRPTKVRRQYRRQFEPTPEMKMFFRYYDDMVIAKRNKFRPGIRELSMFLILPIYLFASLELNFQGKSGFMPYFAFLFAAAAVVGTFAGRISNIVAERRGNLNGYRVLLAARITQLTIFCSLGYAFAIIEGFMVVPGAIIVLMHVYAIFNELRNWHKIRPVIERVSS